MLNDKEYSNFCYDAAFDTSKSEKVFEDRIVELLYPNIQNGEMNCNFTHLITAALGLSGETGEFVEHVKKILLHGKPYDAERRDLMIKELGDVMWYVSQACIALEIDMAEVAQQNVDKLSERHDKPSTSVKT
jgi:NTP pyrophosphatase (non-canonical NTP hydrolase)